MDTLKLISQKEAELSELYERMDDDARLAYLDPFTLKRPDKKDTDVPGASNVTTNAPAVFLNNVISLLTTAVWQTLVEGDLTSRQERNLEQFSDGLRYTVDERRTRRRKPKVAHEEAAHICLRGWIGKRCLWKQVDGKWVPDVVNVDMRWTPFEDGSDGYNWVAPRILMNKAEIEGQFGLTGVRDGVQIPVYDWWDGEKEEILVDGKPAKTNPHRIGYPPFVILGAPEGFMVLLDGEGYLIHEGESILFLNRDMYPIWNQLLTVAQTKAVASILPNIQHKVSELSAKPEQYPPPMAEVRQVLKDEPYEEMPSKDIPQAYVAASEQTAAALQRGGLPDVNYADTATAITEQTELRNKLLAPRLETLAQSRSLEFQMFCDMARTGKIEATLGAPGKRASFKYTDLPDPDTYQVNYKLMSKSKKQEIANLAEAGAAKSIGLSMDTILRDILMSDDPEGEMDRIDSEKAESADPALFYFRKACALADEAAELTGEDADQKKLESMMMTDRGIKALAGAPQMPGQPTPNTNALVPLLGAATKAGVA